MQVQENDGRYRELECINVDKLNACYRDKQIRRILVFPRYDKDGKPTAELRRAWRRWKRIKG